MSKHKTKRPPGQLRQSQVITTFGPGSMIDLPNHSVLIGGLDDWSPGGDEVHEDRLVAKLCEDLQVSALRLVTPPPDQQDPLAPITGIGAWQFPEWFITQNALLGDDKRKSRMLVHRLSLTRGKFIDADKKRQPVVPVRFVRACRRGHIDDIDWRAFVHGKIEGAVCRRQLWLDETGTSGDLSEIVVRCDCGKRRELVEASGFRSKALGTCNGRRPWLGPGVRNENCSEFSRLLVRSASNAYFRTVLSAISLPDRDEVVREAVDAAWDFIGEAENVEDIAHERKKSKVRALLDGVTDEELWSEIQRRRGKNHQNKKVRQPELETLIAAQDEIGSTADDSVFLARNLPRDEWDRPWMQGIERVLLVHRLREVSVLTGFTRFEAETMDAEGELSIDARRAALCRDTPTWLPAVENKGEGIFLKFSTDAIKQWRARPNVKARGKQLMAGFDAWKDDHKNSKQQFVGLPLILLHSFSHALITAVSLECGYPASSIRERIYAIDDVGYGVLLFTGSPDAEGTLGGLVEAGRHVAEHVRAALRLCELCSNDPVCAQHRPDNVDENRFLHGAACHGCLLIAETSCERHNGFLDRALVVPTVENAGAEFFREGWR